MFGVEEFKEKIPLSCRQINMTHKCDLHVKNVKLTSYQKGM